MARFGRLLFIAGLCCLTNAGTLETDHPTPPRPTNHATPKGSTAIPSATSDPQNLQTTSAESTVNHTGCFNKLGYDSCRVYGTGTCHGIYEIWANANCAQYCGYCVDPSFTKAPCNDTIEHCETYDPEICTNADYRIWTEDHCSKFCGFCIATTMPTTVSVDCDNKPGVDCDTFADSACVGIYAPWAIDNCALRCGYCANKEPCFNNLSYCDKYAQDTCASLQFQIWARRNCRQHCGLCYNQTNVFNGTDNKGETPIPVGLTTARPIDTGSTTKPQITTESKPGVIIGQQNIFLVEGPPAKQDGKCLYEGNTYDLNSKWYDGCEYICECFDTKRNRMICTDRCSNWNLVRPIDNCTLVQETGECCERLECSTDL